MAEPTAEQRALFQEHFRPRTDGRPDYTLEEHLRILALVEEDGPDDETLAGRLGVPPAYIRSLRETAAAAGQVAAARRQVTAAGEGEGRMAEKEPDKATCPRCSAHNTRVVGRKGNLRPRPQTGDLRADLTPVSTTVSYECPDCGHGWEETMPP